ncbi:MAG: NfeD family protein [Oscillospiraceae bacterium]|nr:NfeD family protein [Oscillospiraceae bacterium]
MQEWWEGLSGVLRVLYCIAVPSTLILVLQMLLTMIGGHSDGGVDISDTSGLDMPGDADMGFDLDGDGIPDHLADVIDGGNPADFGSLRLLTIQTIVTFLTVFSWVSIICVSSGAKPLSSSMIGAGCGLAMMLLVAKMVQASRKLAENGILNLKNAVGETATVYLTIPPKNGGSGKVTMQLQGRFGEFDAVTISEQPILNGAQVTVTDVQGDVLVVEQSE